MLPTPTVEWQDTLVARIQGGGVSAISGLSTSLAPYLDVSTTDSPTSVRRRKLDIGTLGDLIPLDSSCSASAWSTGMFCSDWWPVRVAQP